LLLRAALTVKSQIPLRYLVADLHLVLDDRPNFCSL